MRRVGMKERIANMRLTVQNDINISVASFPRISQDCPCFLFVSRSDRISKPVERLPKRKSPILIPALMTTGVAAAIIIPALESVRTAPRAVLPNFSLKHWRVLFQIFTIVGQLSELVVFDMVQRIRQRHIAVLVVMAIRFAVSCNVNELRPGTALIGECRRQPRGQLFPACKKILESNRLRDGSVVKEDGDSLPGRKSYFVRCRRIDSSSVHVFPSAAFQLARPFRLVWRKNGIANSETSKDL